MTSHIPLQTFLKSYPLLPPRIKKYVENATSIIELPGHLNTVLEIDGAYILRTKKMKLYEFDDVGSCGNFKAAIDYLNQNNFKLHPSQIVLDSGKTKSGAITDYLLYEKSLGTTLDKFLLTQDDHNKKNTIRHIARVINQLHQIKAVHYGFFNGQQFATWSELIHYWIDKQSNYIQKNKTLTNGEIELVKSIFNKYDDLFYLARPSVIHLDLNFTNIIIDSSGNINSIVDWDNARGGDPIADISYMIERVYNIGDFQKFSSCFLDEYIKVAKIQNKNEFMLKYDLYSLFYAYKLLPVHAIHTNENENVVSLVKHVKKLIARFMSK